MGMKPDSRPVKCRKCYIDMQKVADGWLCNKCGLKWLTEIPDRLRWVLLARPDLLVRILTRKAGEMFGH